MKTSAHYPVAFALALAASVSMGFAQPASITVHMDQPGAQLNRAMWGVFFEDINFGADGGLYAEMVKNRGFEFPDPMMGWFKLSPSKARGTSTTARPRHAGSPPRAATSCARPSPASRLASSAGRSRLPHRRGNERRGNGGS